MKSVKFKTELLITFGSVKQHVILEDHYVTN